MPQLDSCLRPHSPSSPTSRTMPQPERSAVLGPVAPPEAIIIEGHTVISQRVWNTESKSPTAPSSTPEPSLESGSSASSVQASFSASDLERTNSIDSDHSHDTTPRQGNANPQDLQSKASWFENANNDNTLWRGTTDPDELLRVDSLFASAGALSHFERTHHDDTSRSTAAPMNCSNRPASRSPRKVAPHIWQLYDPPHDSWYCYNQMTVGTSWVSPPRIGAAC